MLPRGISDHAPLLLSSLDLSLGSVERIWRLSRFWISDTAVDSQFRMELLGFWAVNVGSADPAVAWDAFKATTRGHYQTIIARVQRERRADLVKAEREASSAEALFVRTRDPAHYSHLQFMTKEAVRLRTCLTQKKMLAQSQRIFEQGERSGRLLAWLSREQAGRMSISHIRDSSGQLIHTPEGINCCFAEFYESVYRSRVDYRGVDLGAYLDDIDIPTLTVPYRDKLDAPITSLEILRALKSMQTGKTPGPDGIPVEFYKQYASELVDKLQVLFSESSRRGKLPDTMSEALIVVIPKPTKDPTLCSSYRPISLLNVDAKLLAKVLANRLNLVITALIHRDQTGFMPGRGTDINIRRLHTHIDRADEVTNGTVASFDAEKAFDSACYTMAPQLEYVPMDASWGSSNCFEARDRGVPFPRVYLLWRWSPWLYC